MIRTVTCVTVQCDECHEGPEFDDGGGEVHFPTYADAVKTLSSWCLQPNGDATCGTCVRDRECAEMGHLYEDWRDCGCQGAVLAHLQAVTVEAITTNTCPMQSRWCERCERHTEYRPQPAAEQGTAHG